MLNHAIVQTGIHNIRHALIVLEQPLIQPEDDSAPAPGRIGFSPDDLPDAIGAMTHHAKPAGPDGFIPFLFAKKHFILPFIKAIFKFHRRDRRDRRENFSFNLPLRGRQMKTTSFGEIEKKTLTFIVVEGM